ncbi:MAG: 30S ribosomal protein S6 [Desulfovibrionaceae bacterium]
MQNYETLLLLSPELEEERRTEIFATCTGIVERDGGKIVEMDDWGMRTLAYPVKKQTRGYYMRMVYDAPGALVQELERIIRITDGIFKFITVKLESPAESQEG